MFERIIGEIRNCFIDKKFVEAVILFGSVARGEANKDSDIDLLIVLSEIDRRKEKIISDIVFQIEKENSVDIQYVIANKRFDRVNKQFLDTILREGILVCGKIPLVSIQKLDLEPYSLIKYDLSKLTHSEKMKLKRVLFGKNTRKKYKGKIYVSKKKGYLEEYKGIKTGIASIMMPEKYASRIVKELRKHGAKVRIIPAWLQKV